MLSDARNRELAEKLRALLVSAQGIAKKLKEAGFEVKTSSVHGDGDIIVDVRRHVEEVL